MSPAPQLDADFINVKIYPDGWILEKMAKKLLDIPGVRITNKVNHKADINYFFNYYLFEETVTTTAAWFTHIEERVPRSVDLWWQTAEAVDLCVFHSDKYRKIVQQKFPKKRCVTISPGVDFNTFVPRKLRIGVVGRAYPETGRKGEFLLNQVISENPDIDWVVTGSKWGLKSKFLDDNEMPALYRSLDYLLITSAYEGGPMSAVEAIASGVQVISPEIGWMPELPHISYETGNVQQLNAILRKLSSQTEELRNSVIDRTWKNFVYQHEQAFKLLMAQVSHES